MFIETSAKAGYNVKQVCNFAFCMSSLSIESITEIMFYMYSFLISYSDALQPLYLAWILRKINRSKTVSVLTLYVI